LRSNLLLQVDVIQGMGYWKAKQSHDTMKTRKMQGISFISAADLKMFNKDKTKVMKVSKNTMFLLYRNYLSTKFLDYLILHWPKTANYPRELTNSDEVEAKNNGLRSTIKCQMKKVLCFNTVWGLVIYFVWPLIGRMKEIQTLESKSTSYVLILFAPIHSTYIYTRHL